MSKKWIAAIVVLAALGIIAHRLLEPFRLDRFRDFSQVGEKGAASVGH